MKRFKPDNKGYYGTYGGAFIPEMLLPNIATLQASYLEIINSESFRKEFRQLLKDYVGRPTPLFYSANLSKRYHTQVFLKREDLNHTGAHKINNTIGQILIAKHLNKQRIIAETGAGQHGVATATACALMGMECTVFMGAVDMKRQAHNVERMRMLGARVVPAESGSRTLKDATNEAIREWIRYPEDTHYIIGSVVGPHPYPDMVAIFQSVISDEIKLQVKAKCGKEHPDIVIACVGGGSNAIGAFYHFIDNGHTRLIAVEAAGMGLESGKTAASIAMGRKGVIHGNMTFLMQTEDGQITEPHSVSAGLDYPGIGPAHAYLWDTGKIEVVSITDEAALKAGLMLTRMDGIIPALESAHAIAYLEYLNAAPEDVVVVNLSGRGDKDLPAYQKYFQSCPID
ncbi:MAG: tryptophan synthase subunit beta [Taibaiella sp.]|nr:tryptophan synthase subunit beta [Taibaiella sp.]